MRFRTPSFVIPLSFATLYKASLREKIPAPNMLPADSWNSLFFVISDQTFLEVRSKILEVKGFSYEGMFNSSMPLGPRILVAFSTSFRSFSGKVGASFDRKSEKLWLKWPARVRTQKSSMIVRCSMKDPTNMWSRPFIQVFAG
jgi:hypothetical protein